MSVKKIQFDGNTLIDLTQDTVVASKLHSGYTAHDANGDVITGSYNPPSGSMNITANGEYNITDYETVNVNVQPDLIEKAISENGTYYASQDGADGYSAVIVDVHPAPLTAMGIDNSGWFLSNNSAENQELILGEDEYGKYLVREVS